MATASRFRQVVAAAVGSATASVAGSVAGSVAADSVAAGSVEEVVGSEEEATQLERLGADAGVVG